MLIQQRKWTTKKSYKRLSKVFVIERLDFIFNVYLRIVQVLAIYFPHKNTEAISGSNHHVVLATTPCIIINKCSFTLNIYIILYIFGQCLNCIYEKVKKNVKGIQNLPKIPFSIVQTAWFKNLSRNRYCLKCSYQIISELEIIYKSYIGYGHPKNKHVGCSIWTNIKVL